eukprot:SAG31_NODE_30291_length_383_cov_0.725352_1_plen_81_part_01
MKVYQDRDTHNLPELHEAWVRLRRAGCLSRRQTSSRAEHRPLHLLLTSGSQQQVHVSRTLFEGEIAHTIRVSVPCSSNELL